MPNAHELHWPCLANQLFILQKLWELSFPSNKTGGGSGTPGNPSPVRTDDCLTLKSLHRQNHNRSYIASELNFRDIQKCSCCFWVQGIITCNRDWWVGVRGRSYFWTKVLTPPSPPLPMKNSWVRPCKIICRALLLNLSNVVTPVNVFLCVQVAEHGVRYKRQQSGYIFFYLYK